MGSTEIRWRSPESIPPVSGSTHLGREKWCAKGLGSASPGVAIGWYWGVLRNHPPLASRCGWVGEAAGLAGGAWDSRRSRSRGEDDAVKTERRQPIDYSVPLF